MNGFSAASRTAQDVRTALTVALNDIDSITVRDEETSLHLRQVRSELQRMDAALRDDADAMQAPVDWKKFAFAFLDNHANGVRSLTERIRQLATDTTRPNEAIRKRLIAATLAAEEARQDAITARRDADVANEVSAHAQQCALLAEQHCNELLERLERAQADVANAENNAQTLLWKGLITGVVLGVALAAWLV